MAGLSDIHHELCLALALWNGADPILKERMFGLTGPAGQPRRGRQGVLVVPRRPAEPRPAAVALPLPAGGLPLPAADRRERPSGPRRPRVRAARHRRLRRRPLLDRRRHLRQGVARPTCSPGSPSRTTGRRRRRSTCCRRCGSATRGGWSDGDDVPSLSLDGDAVRRRPPAARRLPAARPRPASDGTAPSRRCSATTRRTRRGCSATTPITAYPEGRDQRPRRRRRRHGQPGRSGHEGGLVVPAHRAGRRTAELRLRLQPATVAAAPARRRGVVGEAVRRRAAGRDAEADEFYAAIAPDRHSTRSGCGSCARRAPGLVWSKQMYPYQVSRWLDGDPAQPAPPPGSPRRPQRRLAAPRRLRRARHARPVGVPVVRGLGPRVPRDPVGAPRPGVRQVPAARAAPRVVPAPQRRAARVRVELRRRQPARPRARRAARVRHRRRHRHRVPRAGLPEAAAQLHVVAQPSGPRRQQPVRRRLPRARQHQPARPLAPAAPASGSSRPTARRGWRTTPLAMLALAADPRRPTTPSTTTWSSSSSSSSC